MTTRAPAPVDAAILGGGPAGAAAAALLAQWGLRVVVLTRAHSGPALVESLPPSCVRLFDRLGVRATVDAAGFVRSTGNTVHWAGVAPRVEPFAPGLTGYQVPRDKFDAILLAHAERRGAQVVREATITDVIHREGEPSVVRYATGAGPAGQAGGVAAGTSDLAAQWVLDCTGRAGLFARRGWRRPVEGQRTMALVAAWDRATGWEGDAASHTVVESSDAGWGWSVPASATRRLVAVMVDPERTRIGGKARLAECFAEEAARLPALAALVAGATQGAEVFARDASSYGADRVAAPGMLLVGDAASFVDPLSSFGVKKALASAWLAAVVIRSVRDDAAMLAPSLELYERREREIVGALTRRLAAVARDAAAGHGAGFWDAREVEDAALEQPSEPDIARLRDDPAVQSAFRAIREKESITFSVSGALERRRRPTVRDDRVVLGELLVTPAFPEGIRHLRQVDLITLVELAPRFDQVGELYEAYAKAAGVVALPDFLGALSVLVAEGVLATG